MWERLKTYANDVAKGRHFWTLLTATLALTRTLTTRWSGLRFGFSTRNIDATANHDTDHDTDTDMDNATDTDTDKEVGRREEIRDQ